MITTQYKTTLGMLRAKGLGSSPEYRSLEDAIKIGHAQLSAISLEVLISHFRDRFQRVERRFFQRLAQEMRNTEDGRCLTHAIAS